MALLLLAAFILVPLIEIGLFIEVGGWIGLWPTLGLIILTAVIGTALLRQQGLATLRRAQSQMDAGQVPAKELFDGACLLFGGLLLLTPGFFTDAVGFLLLMPPIRDLLRQYLGGRMTRVQMHRAGGGAGGGFGPQPGGPGGPGRPGPQKPGDPPPNPGRGWSRPKQPGPTLEGDYVDVTEETEGPKPSDKGPDKGSDRDRDGN